ncbi:uncharacterized protein AMSG_07421 [Thecamonas trahens ATCC 50062]|uniref:Uncharacterized protein n=1 Tax=Thecamonas trahens ATCC 50062 TaxID=461836 RepID=A0A0L0DGQ6_THETB|nr:hypothetical protein AMSG_07421 [Thecamonas trahens ATCC 50062]KNC51524.1 hypothetical protein AMSG_07421 [Thecamonas trahens ATCC 50062]|eukprot:XP_013755927.1 hypothetical protein AMSG_07421 [Thecamonas trahens ATCC 50062]
MGAVCTVAPKEDNTNSTIVIGTVIVVVVIAVLLILGLLWKISRSGAKAGDRFDDKDYLFEEDTLATYKEDDMPLTHVAVDGEEFGFIPEFDDMPGDAAAAPAPPPPPAAAPKPAAPPPATLDSSDS